MRTIAGFFSDAHFSHAKLVVERGFNSAEDMNAEIASNYNKCFDYDDTVLWLGDCFLHGDIFQCRNMLTELSGTKILILGNHDKSAAAMAAMGFALVLHEAVLNINGVTCRVSHYPYADKRKTTEDKFAHLRPKKHPGEMLIHGHSHHSPRLVNNQINVCSDLWGLKPVMWHEVADLVQEYKDGCK